uniref:Tsukushi small leucine rich proteoglycan homolog (Xenopus laevis) n=1 Tax=Scophthalmus maximus TaxID=52904 RepID=A0A8D3D3X9_SCOMX
MNGGEGIMVLLLCFGLSLLAAVQSSGAIRNCHPGCHCEVESFGLFDSFSLTRVDCRRLGPSTTMPVPIPLDTAHLDLSSNSMGPLSDAMLAGPGYTMLISLDLSSNHITELSPNALSKLRYLETLDLSRNDLQRLSPRCFSGLPLAEVDLSHNSFKEFDMDVFATKVNGEPVSVDLSHNELASVTTTPRGKVLHIQTLNLSANRLSSVPRLPGLPLSGLDGLQGIAPRSFEGLQSLQVLDLSHNHMLKALSPAVFSGLDSLQELNLSGSGVASLPNNMLTHLPSIKSITLGPNIHCWRSPETGAVPPAAGPGPTQRGPELQRGGRRAVRPDAGPLLTIIMPELCLMCFDMQYTLFFV